MILVALFCATNIFAKDYIATQCYLEEKTAYGWSNCDTIKSNLHVVFNDDSPNGKSLIIWSPVTSEIVGMYLLYWDELNKPSDDEILPSYKFIDQDWDRGIIYLMNEENLKQIYIKYGKKRLVYDLIPYIK